MGPIEVSIVTATEEAKNTSAVEKLQDSRSIRRFVEYRLLTHARRGQTEVATACFQAPLT